MGRRRYFLDLEYEPQDIVIGVLWDRRATEEDDAEAQARWADVPHRVRYNVWVYFFPCWALHVTVCHP